MSQNETIETAPVLKRRDIQSLLDADDSGPCVSIYIDTLPATDGKDKNRIRFKDHVKQVSEALAEKDMDKYLREWLIEQLESIGTSEDFWIYQQYGLAVFVSVERTIVRKLMARPGNIALVGEAFHLRPSLQIAHNAARHQILCVSVDQVALYEGDGRSIARIELDSEVPQNMSQALGVPSRVHKVDDDDPGGAEDNQLRDYFRRVDAAIYRHHNRDAKLPLLLTALPEHQGLYREVSNNPNLLQTVLERDPFHGLSDNELGALAWEQVSDALHENIGRLLEDFGQAQAHERGATALSRIGPAAATGQIQTLLVAEEQTVGGYVDPNTGDIQLAGADNPNTNDVIDRIAAMVLRADGTIWFVPDERMPEEAAAAAIFRFAA